MVDNFWLFLLQNHIVALFSSVIVSKSLRDLFNSVYRAIHSSKKVNERDT